ncbi:MAG: hypothetical protein M3Y67_02790, partial [Pseudomonadota bacterium]|nr:hypothetical protein [Pseudomonadota bacterium]
AAIAAVHIVLEVCDSRLAALGSTLQQLVDDFNNGAFVLGPACTDWRGVDYAASRIALRSFTEGPELATGSGMAVLDGDPVGAVVLMANLRPAAPGGLRAGQVVTTGSCTTPFPVTIDGDFIGDFGALGIVRIRFSDGAASASQTRR